ncbi:hypothetical protein [Silvibacterium dinghuense]|uniref:Uncharacterized protein n=1 Tax=Silvibacterium dinghuense TaxID=1560006 RepID=A0A4Q1S8P0_9BACT|nr:hypothetical protein [Silvibacterium dinghuense]RXS93255.1 hypothetical protein ESZ00_17990 [Silvibacterium dinghuense]GGH04361.1 hypothetical protein GCM10011586_20430 [Silvibacterium dinghuense]
MTEKTCFLWAGILAVGLSVAQAQSPQELIQQAVNAEHAADENDHSQWGYLEEVHKPKEQVLQWVAATPKGDVERVLEKNQQKLTAAQQDELIRSFLHDAHAQRKQLAETDHDNKQIDDLMLLLPVAFIWTETSATATDTFLHYEPNPRFHPPTREAHVFSSMAGDLVIDNQQHRIRSMSGHLMHEVNFGGGLLGKLKEGSSFSLEQKQVGPMLWQLTAFHVDLEGNALLFKNISLKQDDKRSAFELEPPAITLDQAAVAVMQRPEGVVF